MSKPTPLPIVVEVATWRLAGLGVEAGEDAERPVRRTERVVREATVALSVNGRTLLRFACLPNRLAELAVGFLASEGLIDTPDQVKAVEVAGDDIRVSADVPFDRFVQFFESVSMVSGCGRAGSSAGADQVPRVTSKTSFSPEVCLSMMRELERGSELFKATGAVHLAALSAGDGLLDVAEDIGRHNAVDKVIGKALRGESGAAGLGDLMLLSTGRLSAEIASKAVRVRLPMVISRSAPTSAAVELARNADLCLVGFARAHRLNVYSAGWRLGLGDRDGEAASPGDAGREGDTCQGHSAVVLAGGKSRRLGTDKAAVKIGGRRLLDRTLALLTGVFDDVVVVGRAAWAEAPADVRLFPDERPGLGPLAGLSTALKLVMHPRALVVGCDMPFLTASAIRELLSHDCDTDATVARADGRSQPLLAVYDRRIGAVIDRLLASGERSLTALLSHIDVHYVELTTPGACFSVNTPEQLAQARRTAKERAER